MQQEQREAKLHSTHAAIMAAERPEDLFGELPEGTDSLKRALRTHLKAVSQDRFQGQPELFAKAEEAGTKLNQLNDAAQKALEAGTYGTFDIVMESEDHQTIEVDGSNLHIRLFVADGEVTQVFGGFTDNDEPFVMKLFTPDEDADSRFGRLYLTREKRVLARLHEDPSALFTEGSPDPRQHFPQGKKLIKVQGGGHALILERKVGFTLAECLSRPQFQNGIGQRHVVWMLNRLMGILGYMELKGIIHGNINPNHIIIEPNDHGIFLVGWGDGLIDPVQTGDTFQILDNFSAPEVKKAVEEEQQNATVLPAADVFSVGLSMLHALGGDIETKTFPSGVHPKLIQFLKLWLLDGPTMRPNTMFKLQKQFEKLVIEMFGPKEFLEFRVWEEPTIS